MAYIRVKKIKDREYAYLVKTKWLKSKKQAKQSVSKYLGRVHSFEKDNELSFLEFVKNDEVSSYLKGKEKKQVIQDLINWEFERHSIKDVKVNKESVVFGKNEVTLKLNEGFMNKHTLKELYGHRKDRSEEAGVDMAKKFVNAGIAIPSEVFVEVFSSNIFK
tara:strand:- start:3987 stop:4472 length:486 start_codon:yes stop_codon:yes gene_type:complete